MKSIDQLKGHFKILQGNTGPVTQNIQENATKLLNVLNDPKATIEALKNISSLHQTGPKTPEISFSVS